MIRRAPGHTEKIARNKLHNQLKKHRDKRSYWLLGYFLWMKSNPKDIRNYNTKTSPYKKIHVDPLRISRRTHRMYRPFSFRKKAFGKVLGGTWDRSPILLKETSLYRAFYQRFENDVPWEQTNFVKKSDNKSARLQECREWESLYENIKSSGYKTQLELLKQEGVTELEELKKNISLDRLYRELASPSVAISEDVQLLRKLLDEVLVDIGRNGELLYVDGKHRLIIAQLLGIDRIPVTVAYRHSEWMEYREALQRHNEQTDWHPDLSEL